MARSSAADRRFLELHNGKWRVSLAVPRDLRDRLGTRIKRPLRTDSLAHANSLKWPIVAEIRADIERSRGIGGDPLMQEALELAKLRRRAEVPALIDEDIHHRAEQIMGKPTGATDTDPAGYTRPAYDERRERQARQYVATARGEATPIALYHEQFLEQAGNHKRTNNDDRRAMQRLAAWCDREGLPPTLQSFGSRKVAVRFRDALPQLGASAQPVTLNKYLQRLSRYWAWLVDREEVETNVFAGLKLTKPRTAGQVVEERAFTDAEVAILLAGPAPQHLRDLMLLGALTGARLDAIVELKVRGIEDGVLIFKPQKKEPRERAVPIHPDLAEIVTRRAAGKAPAADLFPEWPTRREGSIAARSTKASMLFTEYRRALGVDDMVPGNRRSLVNFHSFRRWFITKAEQADQPESIIAAVVGHKRKGMTLGRYSAGPLVAQARRCVEAVTLPGGIQ